MLAYSSHLTAEQARLAQGQRALDQAQAEVLLGRFDQVERWLEKAEVMGIAPGRIRILRGAAALERNQIDEAVHELELAIQQLPNSVAANALLAGALLQKGESGKRLVGLFENTKELTPETPEDYLYGAWVMQHYWQQRALDWVEALATDHPTPVVHYRLGLLRGQGSFLRGDS